jgi:hypothetical protein
MDTCGGSHQSFPAVWLFPLASRLPPLASGPLASGPLGLWASGPLGLWASGPLACSRSVRPKGAKGDSPGQSEAPPWVRLRDGSIGSFTLDDPFGLNLGGFRGL